MKARDAPEFGTVHFCLGASVPNQSALLWERASTILELETSRNEEPFSFLGDELTNYGANGLNQIKIHQDFPEASKLLVLCFRGQSPGHGYVWGCLISSMLLSLCSPALSRSAHL